MTTNKTPIQELIGYCTRTRFNVEQTDGFRFEALDYDDIIIAIREEFEQKEKAFAFDCFTEGMNYGVARILYGGDGNNYSFEQFYSQYAEQHTE